MKQLLITIAAVVLVGCGPRMSIHEAAEAGNIESVKQHLANGTDIEAKDDGGFTPLHYARGDKKIAELLITNGADVNARNSKGETPLDWAVNINNANADLLRKHGAKTAEELKAEGQ